MDFISPIKINVMFAVSLVVLQGLDMVRLKFTEEKVEVKQYGKKFENFSNFSTLKIAQIIHTVITGKNLEDEYKYQCVSIIIARKRKWTTDDDERTG